MSVRTRFAPSPTGALHLGNVRVGVFNWLFARKHGGAFVVRMEDTDTDRNLPGSEASILEDLRWLGLDWDEGPDIGGPYGPYRQSERGRFYREAADALLARGLAYLSYDDPEEAADEGRETGDGAGSRRPFRARSAEEEERRRAAGILPVVRFRVPLEPIEVEDETRGIIHIHGKEIGDFVILRSDGRPTYNFAVVVDDVGMGITHVIRGAGHLSNTPRQALIFDALGAPRPRFVHLPTVLGPDRRKLSKRSGAEAVAELRARGVPPSAVVNYLSLLGWSAPDGREVLPVAELVEQISLERLGSADTVYDPVKLRWVASQHLAALSDRELARAVEPWLDRGRFPLEGEALEAGVAAVRSHLTALGEIGRELEPLFPEPALLAAEAKVLAREPASLSTLRAVRVELAEAEWLETSLGEAIREAGRKAGVRGSALFHPIRRALTGRSSGPELGKVLVALGRDEVLRRIDAVFSAGV